MRSLLAAATILTIGTALAVAGPATPTRGADDPPPSIALVAPADGATARPGDPLSVRVDSAGGEPLTVTFHGGPRGAGDSREPFTFLTIPDTQGYVITSTYTGILRDQLRWIADNDDSLNLAFATGLGDIVDNHISTAQWTRATEAMAILDTAGVPYAVLPGNHDFNLATGDFAGYNTNFPVSRFRDAAWNTATTHYGGYYGQNEFGADLADRQNMNNYSVFAAGGMEFVLVTLELNPPDGVLAWADRVIDAHPDHRVIVATHAYVNTTGALSNQVQRTDQPGNSGAQVFQKLIRPHCNVFLVVNGHFSDGTLGEARRSDQNACGGTVHGILTDFQGRPNGGDGWLRYYRFVPASNEIEAVTYSPTRNEYERDADSSFVLPYDMTVAGGTQPELGSVTVDPGATASIDLPDLPSGTEFEWYASVSDGTATTESARWTVTVSDEVPPLAVDTFSRTSTAGWGTADTGGAWTVNSAAKFTVAGGVGRIAANAGSTLTATLPSVSTTDIDLQTTLAVDKLPQQRLDLTVFTRLIGTGGYAARLKLQPTGALTIEAVRDTTVLATRTLPAGTVTAGTPLRIRIQTQGTAPTTVRARVWTGTTEPTTWHVTATDTTAALQQPGTLRLTSYLSSSATNGPVTVTYDDLRAGSSQTAPPPPPPNAAPTAAFTWTAQGRTVTADSGDSVDADGQIVSRTWSFDGATKTGTTATHTFAQAGTFPVSLTVTDDDGATNTVTKTVTVSDEVPPLAVDTFSRTSTAGWGTADTGGAWTVNSAAKFTVAGGVGRIAANAGSTLTATLPSVSTTDIDLQTTLAVDKLPQQRLDLTVFTRLIGTGGYAARLKLQPTGALTIEAVRDTTVLATRTLPAGTVTAGTPLRIRIQTQGTAPTTVRARVWTGTTEPTTWHVTATDTTAALQQPGTLRLTSYLSSSATNGPVTVTYDDLRATAGP